ncbi:MAG: hypothetical protein HYW70_03585 [Candidatus Nealsonbacteria bacterium]|nr:hypothetical protein [Candidatus Nealsonbacteria bacterium]
MNTQSKDIADIELKQLIKKWNTRQYQYAIDGVTPRQCRELNLLLANLLEDQPHRFAIHDLLIFLQRGGINGRLYKLAISTLTSRELNSADIVAIWDSEGYMNIQDQAQVLRFFLVSRRPTVEILQGILDKLVTEKGSRISKDKRLVFLSVVREICGEKTYKYLQLRCLGRLKEAYDWESPWH